MLDNRFLEFVRLRAPRRRWWGRPGPVVAFVPVEHHVPRTHVPDPRLFKPWVRLVLYLTGALACVVTLWHLGLIRTG